MPTALLSLLQSRWEGTGTFHAEASFSGRPARWGNARTLFSKREALFQTVDLPGCAAANGNASRRVRSVPVPEKQTTKRLGCADRMHGRAAQTDCRNELQQMVLAVYDFSHTAVAKRRPAAIAVLHKRLPTLPADVWVSSITGRFSGSSGHTDGPPFSEPF